MNQFTELSLCSALHANLSRHGFTQPTPVQAAAIPVALEGRDVVATAQTGTGKTLAFVLPLLERLGQETATQAAQRCVRALILSPTRELALQIQETFVKLAANTNLRSVAVVGGMSEQTQLRGIRAGHQVLIATPGRLEDYLRRKLVDLSKVEIVVLDEADRMLDMGFLPAIEGILKVLPAARQTLFFSATMDPSITHLINKHLKTPERITIGSSTKPAEQVDLHVYEVSQEQKQALLESMLREQTGSFLVFARTKHGTDRLATRLVRNGHAAAAIHGDRTQGQRNRALDGFRKGQYRVLVATDVAARGIHVENIGHVINFDLPQAPEDFVHRVGRTGRAGLRGLASTFSTRPERNEIRRIERTLKIQLTRREVPEGLAEEIAREVAPEIVKAAAHPPVKAAPSEFRHARPPQAKAPNGKAPHGKDTRRRTGSPTGAKSTSGSGAKKEGPKRRFEEPFWAAIYRDRGR